MSARLQNTAHYPRDLQHRTSARPTVVSQLRPSLRHARLLSPDSSLLSLVHTPRRDCRLRNKQSPEWALAQDVQPRHPPAPKSPARNQSNDASLAVSGGPDRQATSNRTPMPDPDRLLAKLCGTI